MPSPVPAIKRHSRPLPPEIAGQLSDDWLFWLPAAGDRIEYFAKGPDRERSGVLGEVSALYLALSAQPSWHEYLERARASSASEATMSIQNASGQQRWIQARAARDTAFLGVYVLLRDVTACRDQERRLEQAQAAGAEAGARLQTAVLVNGPEIRSGSISVACTTIPSRLVDGDFLDVFRLDSGTVDFLLGDVMGKGMEAATLATLVKYSLFRELSTSLFGRKDLPPVAEICALLEKTVTGHLYARRSIVTLSYLRYHEASRALEIVDCGHTPLVVYRALSDECVLVKGSDMPLGFADAQQFRTFTLPLWPGDIVLAFSDGLSECNGSDDQPFGEDRIMHVVRGHKNSDSRALVDQLIRLGYEYSAGGFTDDVSITCFRVGPSDLPVQGSGCGKIRSCKASRRTLKGSKRIRLNTGDSSGQDRLRGRLDLLLHIPCIDEDTRFQLVLACAEALDNIAEHALKSEPGTCLVAWRLLPGLFSVEFSYAGAEYEWLRQPDSPVADYAGRGYGLSIIHAVMDSVLLAGGLHDRRVLFLCRRLPCMTI